MDAAPAVKTAPLPRPAVRKITAWLRAHPLTAICVAIIASAVGLHLFANWRAEVRWQNYCTAARARGVKLTLAEFAPPEIPDAENFAALPMFKAIRNGGVQRPMKLPRAGGTQPDFGNPLKAEPFDWAKWQTLFKEAGYITETTDSPPRDVLRALEHYAPQFQEWSEWKTRPRCRFPFDYNAEIDFALVPLQTFRDASRLFTLRLRAHLALDDSAAAYADFCEVFQTRRTLENEPTLVVAMAQTSVLDFMCDGVGDGLARHAWADAELAKIGSDLATVALWKRYRLALQTDRAVNNLMYDRYAASSPIGRWKLYTASLGGAPSPPVMSYIKFTPRRFFRDNQLRHNQWLDELLARFNQDATSYDPDGAAPASPRNWNTWIDAFYYFLFRVTAFPTAGMETRFVKAQTKLDQTRTAIALERFRLARGAFPETLTELVPDFFAAVPVDTFSKQPLIYRRTDGGTFLLYGVGQNRTDGGGAINPKLYETKQPDDVWPYAPPPAL